MLLQIVSDLHLETYPSYKNYKHCLTDATYLALLGDIGHIIRPEFEQLIILFLNHYSIVFYLLGNHDTKDLTMAAVKIRMRAFEARMAKITSERTIGRFVFLDRTRLDIDAHTTILGCTLYSHVPPEHESLVACRMIEFSETRSWTVPQHNEAHAGDVAWLDAEVLRIEHDDPHRSIVVLTHHCPTVDSRSADPKHKSSKMTCAFATDLSRNKCWNSRCVKLWAWGHTHWNCEFEVERGEAGPLKCYTNQKGYYRFPKDDFDETALIELPGGKIHRTRKDQTGRGSRDHQRHAQSVTKGDKRKGIFSSVRSIFQH